MKPDQVLALVRNKTKRLCLALNPQLWALFEKASADEGLTPTNKIEDLIINYLDIKGYLENKSEDF